MILHRDRLRAMEEWFEPRDLEDATAVFDDLGRRLDHPPTQQSSELVGDFNELYRHVWELFEGTPTDAGADEVFELADDLAMEIGKYTRELEKLHSILDRLQDLAIDRDELEIDPVRPEDSQNPNQKRDWDDF